MVAFDPCPVPGGKHPKGPLLEPSWGSKIQEPCVLKERTTPGKISSSLLASGGPSSTYHFLILRVLFLVLNCLNFAVEATKDTSSDMRSNEPILYGAFANVSAGRPIWKPVSSSPLPYFSPSSRSPILDFTNMEGHVNDRSISFGNARRVADTPGIPTFPFNLKGNTDTKEDPLEKDLQGIYWVSSESTPEAHWNDKSNSGNLKSKVALIRDAKKSGPFSWSGKLETVRNCDLCRKRYLYKTNQHIVHSRNASGIDATYPVTQRSLLAKVESKPGLLPFQDRWIKSSIGQGREKIFHGYITGHTNSNALDNLKDDDVQKGSRLKDNDGSKDTNVQDARPTAPSRISVFVDSSKREKETEDSERKRDLKGDWTEEGMSAMSPKTGTDKESEERVIKIEMEKKNQLNVKGNKTSESEYDNHHSSRKSRRRRKIDTVDVTVVAGRVAALPCDLNLDDPKDTVQLILWIKEGVHTPLYSYDYRNLLGGQPRETRPDANSTLSRRTSFRADRSPAALVIEKTELGDAGIYRCRVDFLLSPTINRRVNLAVIVPPRELRVSWQLGNSGLMEVRNRLAGPFLEGSQPSLVCFSDDGFPAPSLSWYEGDDLLDETFSQDPVKTLVENELLLNVLTRDDLGRRLTCQANNSNMALPTTLTVSIAMTLSILSVEVEPLGVIWASEGVDVECHVWGSRPAPSVVWWLGARMIPSSQSGILDEGNETVSVLSLVPEPKDDGCVLTCQATNEKLPDQAVQDSIVLDVHYAPVVEVGLGSSLDPQEIKEGDNVYFECSVKAKPPAFKITWKHNDRVLTDGVSEDILVSDTSLVVQRVTKEQAGNYTCQATNVRNTSASDPLRLDVKYAPVCASKEMIKFSVGKSERAEISCRVDANPKDVTFRWTFNNTAEAIDVPKDRFVAVGAESKVIYTPMDDQDYGTLLCWASNSAGAQRTPCVFQITTADKPKPPHNCRVFDVTVSSLQVACKTGDDGELKQNFSLRVYQVGSTTPLVQVTRSSPSFSVSGLRPATAYKITVDAASDKGSYKVAELKTYTLRIPDTPEETNAEPARDQSQETRVPLAVTIGAAVAVVPVLVIVILLLSKIRANRACRRSGGVPGVARTEKDSCSKDLPSTSPPDESNPDIISHTPDPVVWESEKESRISTIASVADLTSAGGSSAADTYIFVASSNGDGQDPAMSRVLEDEHQLPCLVHHLPPPPPPPPPPPHIHDTTCLNTSRHAHTCLVTADAAKLHVPYEPQAADIDASPTVPKHSECSSGGHLALPSQPSSSTLGRKRLSQSTQHRCPHFEGIPKKALQGTQQGHLQVCLPHILQQIPDIRTVSSALDNKENLHINRLHGQEHPKQAPGLSRQSTFGSQSTLAQITGFSGLPECPRPMNPESDQGDDSKSFGGNPLGILLPPTLKHLRSEDKKATSAKGGCPPSSATNSPSPSGKEARESSM